MGSGTANFLRSLRVARLGTLNEDGTVHMVPIVFANSSRFLYFVIDRKTKKTRKLRRLQNIRRTGRATVLVDNYAEDWRKLSFVMIYAKARVLGNKERIEARRALKLLKRKYPQYRSNDYLSIDEEYPIVVRLAPIKLIRWSQKSDRPTRV
jgi:PPOX class probable F420-dependent enzyme